MKYYTLAALPAVLLFSFPAQASWLSEITGVHINPSAGEFKVTKPNIAAIPDMLQHLPQDAAQFFLNPQGAQLAEAIRISRNTNIGSASPLPPEVRQALAPFFPPGILAKARYRVKAGALSLPSAINLFDPGNAVTLDDLIIFDNAGQTQDIELWAHELTHIVQYSNMGVESFANVYSLTGGSGLEAQARDNAAQIRNALNHTMPNNVQPNYQYAPNAFTAPTPQTAFVQAAQQVVPPQYCMSLAPHPAGVAVQNGCTVPVAVTGWQIQGPMGPYNIPCPFNCVVGPMMWKPFGPMPGPILGFYYQW
jgi:hypothetical protein